MMLMQANQLPRTRPLRVLMALPGLHRITRGAEVVFEEVARAMARSGGGEAFDVTAVGSGPDRADEPYHYRRAGCVSRERFENWPSLPYLRGHYVYEELTFTPGFLASFSPGDFDVTVTCSYPYVSWAMRMRRRQHELPRHVFVTQNGDWMVRGKNWEFKHFACDGLVCTNPEYYERHKNRWRCALIPNGVHPEIFHPGPADRAAFNLPENRPVILMVAALIPSKRILEGIRAAAKVPDAHLIVAGSIARARVDGRAVPAGDPATGADAGVVSRGGRAAAHEPGRAVREHLP
jgi:glycosyltransferase involved in cell wall biosynthesis